MFSVGLGIGEAEVRRGSGMTRKKKGDPRHRSEFLLVVRVTVAKDVPACCLCDRNRKGEWHEKEAHSKVEGGWRAWIQGGACTRPPGLCFKQKKTPTPFKAS